MTKNQKPAKKNQRPKGTMTAEVAVQATPQRAFLAIVDGVGRDQEGKVIGANGIRWAI